MNQRKPWLKPTLQTHRTGVANKFGGMKPNFQLSEIDGVALEPLLEQYGSPLFVISERNLRESERRLKRAFASRWPVVRHGWSYKTNYLGAVCNILHQEGAWAEVVSEFEYQKARSLGVPGARIIYNGPLKSRVSLMRAAAEGAVIHLDHLDELYMLEEVARDLKKCIPVGIRLNFDTGFTDPWSRFGFNIEAGAARDAARRISASKWLRLNGLHSHIGTFVSDTRAYAAQVRVMAAFMETVERDGAGPIEYLDIGGGFASRNSLQGVYLPPEQIIPSFDQYAEAIVGALMDATRERTASGRALPDLVLETGRAVVDESETLITRVAGGKRLPDGRRAAILDAGINLLFTGFWYNHEIKPLRALEGIPEETVLYGPLCMNIDVVRASVMLPPLSVGDALAIRPVGAYNNTQWMQFIQYRPAIVMITADGSVEIVRAAEDLASMTALERLPATLRDPFPRGLPE